MSEAIISNAIVAGLILSAIGMMWRRIEKHKRKFDGFVDIFAESHPEFNIRRFRKDYC